MTATAMILCTADASGPPVPYLVLILFNYPVSLGNERPIFQNKSESISATQIPTLFPVVPQRN